MGVNILAYNAWREGIASKSSEEGVLGSRQKLLIPAESKEILFSFT